MPATPEVTMPFLGGAFPRIDGPLKVSGRADYTADHYFPGMLYAVPVCATIARGVLASLSVDSAARMPGVEKIYTRENIGRFYRVSGASGQMVDEKRPPMDDDVIRYYGQVIALVVADTFETATAAADAITATYTDVQSPDIRPRLSADNKPDVESERGDIQAALARDLACIDQTYTTPPETHNPIELHSSVAIFDGTRYTFYETSQAIVNHKGVLVQMLGVPAENVQVITHFLGSGFGGKLWPWTHSLLAAAATRDLRRPVKLEITRKMMFQLVGHRPNTQQRIRLAAQPDGKLAAVSHDYLYHVSQLDEYKEDCGEATPYLYSTPNLRVTSAYARRDVAPATSMRGPGAVPGLFALESAMDELAIRLDICPVQLRLVNEPAIDESLGVPFSERHLRECLDKGSERFGWSRRTSAVGSMRRDGKILGWGMACASWLARRLAAQAAVRFNDDGRITVSSATQDLGTGTYTVMAQMVGELTGVPIQRIDVRIGDTRLPPGPMSGGSMATGSMVPAVAAAARDAIKKLIKTVEQANGLPLARVAASNLTYQAGRVHRKGQDPDGGLPFEQVLRAARVNHIEGSGRAGSSGSDPDAKTHSLHSYGAHFVEVEWEPQLARLRVSRTLTVIDAGTIINPRTGRNQIEGAVVMGLGMALFEDTHYESSLGAPINSNLADYVMCTNADAPEMDVLFLDYPDKALNEFGARGIGEIGLAGVAAAITAAVYHATGIRVRDLPVQIEDLIGKPSA